MVFEMLACVALLSPEQAAGTPKPAPAAQSKQEKPKPGPKAAEAPKKPEPSKNAAPAPGSEPKKAQETKKAEKPKAPPPPSNASKAPAPTPAKTTAQPPSGPIRRAFRWLMGR